MASLFQKYNALLIRRPLIAQCATAAVLFGSGDVIAQQVIERKGKDHDILRTARLSFYGGAMFGPVITHWFQYLGRIQTKTPLGGIITKVVLDQAVCAPLAVGAFFTSMAVLEGKPGEVVPRIQDKYLNTVAMNWGVFIPTQLINFWLIPPQLRFGFVGVVSLFWNTYLSAANASAEEHTIESIHEVPVLEKKVLPA